MQSTETVTGGVAQEPTAEMARAIESESDQERFSETGSSMGSAKKNAQSMESCFGEILCFQDGRRYQLPGRSKKQLP